MEIGVLALIALAIYAAYSSSTAGGVGTATLGPGGDAGPGGQPGPGRVQVAPPGGRMPAPGGSGAAPIAPLVPLVPKVIDKLLPTSTKPDAPPMRPPIPDPTALIGMSAEWEAALAAAGQDAVDVAGALVSTGIAPDAAANIAVTMAGPYGIATGESALGATLAATGGAEATATGVGGAVAASMGWALPIAALAFIGGGILSAAMEGDQINKSKDEQKRRVAAGGKARAYQVINAMLDALLATGERPDYMTDVWLFNNGFYGNFLESAGDTWGMDADYQAAHAKLNTYLLRFAESNQWFINFADAVKQTLGFALPTDPEGLLRGLLARFPAPAWLGGWKIAQLLMRMPAMDLVKIFVWMARNSTTMGTVMALGPATIAADYLRPLGDYFSQTGGEAG